MLLKLTMKWSVFFVSAKSGSEKNLRLKRCPNSDRSATILWVINWVRIFHLFWSTNMLLMCRDVVRSFLIKASMKRRTSKSHKFSRKFLSFEALEMSNDSNFISSITGTALKTIHPRVIHPFHPRAPAQSGRTHKRDKKWSANVWYNELKPFLKWARKTRHRNRTQLSSQSLKIAKRVKNQPRAVSFDYSRGSSTVLSLFSTGWYRFNGIRLLSFIKTFPFHSSSPFLRGKWDYFYAALKRM